MPKFNFKVLLIFFAFCLLTFFSSASKIAYAETTPTPSLQNNQLNIYLFWGDGCPHCAKLEKYFDKILPGYGERIKLNSFEIWHHEENVDMMKLVAEKLKIDASGVPLTIVGDKEFVGYGSDETTGAEIKKRIDYCLKNTCSDSVFELINASKTKPPTTSVTPTPTEQIQKQVNQKIHVPFFGDVNLSNMSLPLATIVIAFVDGFNPCAMWILIFLISLLIGMQNRKRLYILGSIFLGTSALVYFVFLNAWFSIFQFIGAVSWIKITIGIVAIVSGILHLKSGLKSKGECHVTTDSKRSQIMEKVKRIVSENSYWLAIIGIVTLAASVNLVELVCSAGLPAIYTALLANSGLSWLESFFYMLLYIFIFMLDDLIVFFVAVKTLELTGLANKYVKISNIAGGIIIIIIGILLLFKPGWLLFG